MSRASHRPICRSDALSGASVNKEDMGEAVDVMLVPARTTALDTLRGVSLRELQRKLRLSGPSMRDQCGDTPRGTREDRL